MSTSLIADPGAARHVSSSVCLPHSRVAAVIPPPYRRLTLTVRRLAPWRSD
jgi:hypothetical protein